MKRVCAWCGRPMESSASSSSGEDVTHGMCPSCQDFLESNQPERTLRKFLDSLPVPILMVNEEGRITTANERARVLLQKDITEIENHLGGDAMECVYARLPGGCGQTEHCEACTIRRSVMDTYATGESLCRRTALQDIQTPHGPVRMRFLISTRKVGQTVFLRIDEAGPAPEPAPS